jgi:hypothetical protein
MEMSWVLVALKSRFPDRVSGQLCTTRRRRRRRMEKFEPVDSEGEMNGRVELL